MLIDIVAGARPNFMKIAPIIKEIEVQSHMEKKLTIGWFILDNIMIKKCLTLFRSIKYPKT